nr:MAG TPA: hypothetical protein [Caudoviricetes sp.]
MTPSLPSRRAGIVRFAASVSSTSSVTRRAAPRRLREFSDA